MSTGTGTASITFTKIHAEHLASKVGSDLYQVQQFYGKPNTTDIENYMAELVILLVGGYLESVDYGYKKNDKYVLGVHYKVLPNLGLVRDDSTGKIPFGVDISDAHWSSFLRKSQKFLNLSVDEQNKVNATLPFQRTGMRDPLTGVSPTFDNKYSAGGTDFSRGIIT